MPGLLLFGDTERSAALRHEIPVAIMDPLLFAEIDGRRVVLTSMLERERVTRALPDAEVLDYFEFGWKELIEGGMSFAEAERRGGGAGRAPDRDRRRDRSGRLPARGRRPAASRRGRAHRRRRDGGVSAAREIGRGARRHPRRPAGGRGRDWPRRATCSSARARPRTAGCELDGERLLAEDVRAALRAACAEHGAPCPPDVIVGVGPERLRPRPGQRAAAERTSDRDRPLAAPRGERLLGGHDPHVRGRGAHAGARRPDRRPRAPLAGRARSRPGGDPSRHPRPRALRPASATCSRQRAI